MSENFKIYLSAVFIFSGVLLLFFLPTFVFASTSEWSRPTNTAANTYQNSNNYRFVQINSTGAAGTLTALVVGSTTNISATNYDAYTVCRIQSSADCSLNIVVPPNHFYRQTLGTTVIWFEYDVEQVSNEFVFNPNQDFFNGMLLFLIGLFGVIYIFKKR